MLAALSLPWRLDLARVIQVSGEKYKTGTMSDHPWKIPTALPTRKRWGNTIERSALDRT